MEKANLSNAVLKSRGVTVVVPLMYRNSHLSFLGEISVKRAVLMLMFIAGQWLSAPAVYAAEGICGSCSYRVSVTGDFTHVKANESDNIESGSDDVSAFYEAINGKEFSVSVLNLPVDKYTIIIGEIEFSVKASDERIFDVTCGDVKLAENFDIYSVAGGMRKICYITGEIEHTGDELRGPVKVVFKAVRENAKFNTFEIRNSSL